MLQRKIHIDSFIIIKKIFNEFGIKRQVDSNGMMKKKSLNLGSLTKQAISYTIRHYEASYLGDFFTRAQNIIILRTKIASTYPLNEHILEKSVNAHRYECKNNSALF